MTKRPNITAIVLAAGQSTRMGKTNKLLAKFNGKTLLQHVLTNLQQSVVDEIFVVTGYEADKVKASIADFDVQCIKNDQYSNGLSSSIKIGIESLDENAKAALICHADMPFIRPRMINAILDAFIDLGQIVMPTYKGRQGNPLLWPNRYFEKLLQLSGDVGARQILKNHQDEIIRLDIDDVGVLLDIDDPQTLRLIQSKFDKDQEKVNAN